MSELAITRPDLPAVAFALTPATFDHARTAHVVRGEADVEAMRHIAEEIGVIDNGRPLPPLMLVGRGGGRITIGGWDYRLPTDSSSPTTARYYSANELHLSDEERPATVNREGLVAAARQIGATALTEITMW